MKQTKKRTIRSFVRRSGRMTVSQKEALEHYWSLYGLSIELGQLDFTQIFARKSDVILEIGFGMGQSLITIASHHPNIDYVGVEVHQPGVGALLQQIVEKELKNIRIFQHDVTEVLAMNVPDESLSGVQIFFPDPWPKQKHHKRRLIQTEFIEVLWRKLKTGGKLHLATDWHDYALQMMKVLSHAQGFENVAGEGRYLENAHQFRPVTKFEQRGTRLGHKVWDLMFIKKAY